MNRDAFLRMENYMRACMADSAHDTEHVYRVLYNALQIAQTETGVNYDVLLAACLLHDIGRKEQFEDPTLCHARVGSEKAFRFLTEQGYSQDFAGHVRDCILTHRFRKAMPPETLEAKILFDADKLDVTGALGIARTLMYKGDMAEPLYHVLPDGSVSDGTQDSLPSFFREYRFKLEKLYDRFYTQTGAALAQQRQKISAVFYETLYREVSAGRANGAKLLQHILEDGE